MVANNKVNHQHGRPQPHEASSIDLPELPTPPRFKSWRPAVRRVVAAASTQPQAALQWVLMVGYDTIRPTTYTDPKWIHNPGREAKRRRLEDFKW
eukprot:3713925-Amphidinium_carterae.1